MSSGVNSILSGPIILSVKVAILSTIIVTVAGTLLALVMHRRRFPGQAGLETLIGLPLVLPPTVIGFGLLLLFGRNGPLGSTLESVFHVRIVFTWWAAVIAAAVVSLPLLYRSAKAAFQAVDRNMEQAARTLGASELRVFWTVTLPLARPGVLAGVLLAFARALGEFGATLMLAGNIPGQTQTIPLAIFFAAESGDIETAGYLVAVITLISFVVTYWLNDQSRKQQMRTSAKRGVKNAGSGHHEMPA